MDAQQVDDHSWSVGQAYWLVAAMRILRARHFDIRLLYRRRVTARNVALEELIIRQREGVALTGFGT